MTSNNGEDDSKGESKSAPPASRTQNYFAVPHRGQLAGRAYMAMPTHVRSPLAQTPSPVASDDNPLSPGPPSAPFQSTGLREELFNPASAPNDDSRLAQPVSLSQESLDLSSEPSLSFSSSTASESVSWPDFLEQYAEGKWDPSRPPPKPDSISSAPRPPRRKSTSAPPSDGSPSPPRPPITYKNASDMDTRKSSPPRLSATGRTQSSPETSAIDTPTLMQRRGAEKLVLEGFAPTAFPGHSTTKWTAARNTTPSPPVALAHPHPITPTAVVDAATVRWAGARVKIAPLSLSSPERTSL